MKNNREEIEQIKKDFRKRLESDVNFLKSGIIRELDYLMRNNQDKDLNILVEEASKKLKFQGSSKIKLINEVKETQLKIATVWKEYFSSVTDSKYLNDGNYEKMLSVYSVDFNTLEEKTRQTVTREISKSINNEYSYDIVRTNLIRSGIGTNEAYTLANTAV
ncbi:MAG: hypothetical protein Q8933_20095, partial [Bacteroidota bacterium]|nr:hypothetical protein [Bacteroidota bacterium]